MTDLEESSTAETGASVATRDHLLARIDDGERFAGLVGDGDIATGLTLHALVIDEARVEVLDLPLRPGQASYAALTPDLPSAFWYERVLHDLYGVTPLGHPRLDPLVLPQRDGNALLPSPGAQVHPARVEPDERALARHVMGTGLFSIPHGPVRSGVFESVEYVVETPGEDISHVNVRPFAKHRGVEVRFESLSVADGVLLAERVEGISSVAHALAYSHALEALAETEPPISARLVRVLHAELERIANHLDVALKLADAAGLAVAAARFGWHKERVLRLVSRLCGSRFGRGVVVPGGVRRLPLIGPDLIRAEIKRLAHDVQADATLLMNTPSFLDRLRDTGPLGPDIAMEHGTLGPVGRASGLSDDARWHRPYDAYLLLDRGQVPDRLDGDAMARLQVRWDEVEESFDLLGQVLDLLVTRATDDLSTRLELPAGQAIGWTEAAQGELLYLLRIDGEGRIARCAPRSASFHNLSVFSRTFTGDILTDFPFIEASFGVSIAGVVM
jgi:formate hydrogenlyase subunit 5